MRTLLLDNYDSFTYNLFQLLAEVNGEEPIVVRNDAAEWAELAARGDFDNIVVSPGPGNPEREADFGVCAAAIRESELPLLGVCLGHQGLCATHGARVVRAGEPMHGRISAIRHDGSGLFAGLPRRLEVVRYHSLCVEQPLPPSLRAVAWTEDGTLMAVAHRERPQWGLQFHPESVCSEHGRALLANFRDLSARRSAAAPRRRRPASSLSPPVAAELELRVERIAAAPDPERAFVHLYGATESAFWLDSATAGAGPARFSFMGDAAGPLGAIVAYEVGSGELRLRRGGEEEVRRESIFDYLAAELRRPRPRGPELPFDFGCGFAGYLGYELKAECGGDRAHASSLPDAFLIYADRMLAFDHREEVVYLLGLHRPGEAAATESWLAQMRQRLAALPQLQPPDVDAGADASFRLARSRQRYLDDIAACQERLREGESYEICLTNRIVVEADPDPLELYRELRRVNPAPHAAYLRLGGAAVLSSSPERFLAVGRDRQVEARPIKGTAPRGGDPEEDARLAAGLRLGEKTRAENLTICDLLRNDLGAVCEVGSVHVPALMEVESYESVHQLVTTVRGQLREGLGAVECVRACFPGGSMTGAPKRRTMQVIDALEGEARGVYSGALGYFGLGGGCDLSIVIRTVVVADGATTIGVGGAIVTQSDPDEEFEEILLKGEAPLRAIAPGADLRSAAGEPALS